MQRDDAVLVKVEPLEAKDLWWIHPHEGDELGKGIRKFWRQPVKAEWLWLGTDQANNGDMTLLTQIGLPTQAVRLPAFRVLRAQLTDKTLQLLHLCERSNKRKAKLSLRLMLASSVTWRRFHTKLLF